MAAGIAAGQLAMPTTAFAQTNYNVASLADFTGPYADVMKNLVGGRWAKVVAWWNEEVGKGLGVKINMKDFDHRYDAAQVASLWPGIKSELKPTRCWAWADPMWPRCSSACPTTRSRC